MGGWKLEAFKMGIYMVFPVGVFWWFNQPTFFEKWMTEQRKQLFPPEDPHVREGIRNTIRMMEERKQRRLEASLKAAEAKMESKRVI